MPKSAEGNNMALMIEDMHGDARSLAKRAAPRGRVPMDGCEATAAIPAHEQQSGHHLPIIALTAHAMQGDRDRCLTVGMDDYIVKPLQAADLYAAIERLLPRPRVQSALSAVLPVAPARSQPGRRHSWKLSF
jgi:CheY-like chemotaxis protein